MIHSGDLSLCIIEEIKAELKKKKRSDVKRITIKKRNKIINTNKYILTFNILTPPTEIKISYLIAKVGKYIPNLRRCHKCQRYDHLKKYCTRKPIFVRCGEIEPNHDETTYKNQPKCNNCNGDHRSDAKECKIWEIEK